jgi:transposase
VSRPLLLPSLVRFRLLAHHRSHGVIRLDLSARQRSAACPRCQRHSTAVHRAYRRTIADVPLSGAKTVLHLQVRRFFCRCAACPQRIFGERFSRLVPVRGRHSEGAYAVLGNIGLAVGGRAGARLARALGVPGSARMILRLVQRASLPSLPGPRVIGLDEWTWRRGRRFGTIVCDLERHQVVDLLPDRSVASVAQWFQSHPTVELVCRDRSGPYAEGIRRGAPQAVQVVDRFHLARNVHDVLERFFLRYCQGLKILTASFPHTSLGRLPQPPLSAATISRQRHERWIHLYHQIQQLHAQHWGVAAIAPRVQVSRPTVYRDLAMPQPPEHQRARHRGLLLIAPFTSYRRHRWNAGYRNAQQLWRELVMQGYRPSRRTVERYMGQLRQETGSRFKFRQAVPAPLYDKANPDSTPAPMTALWAARLFLAKPGHQRPTDRALLARLLCLDCVMPRTYHQVQCFRQMVRDRHGHGVDAWITEVQHAGVRELRGFAKGLLRDGAAVRAGLSLVWSNGPTEGYVHRLKLLKRQAYGRAGVDLFRHRMLPRLSREAA